jgi:MazG family protein
MTDPVAPIGSDDPRLLAFARLLAVIDRLRAEDGCPWDRKQTLGSMAPHILEESYEVVDALVHDRRAAVREELGDLLMNILLCARIAQDGGVFDCGDVANEITDKLVRRHPHVFDVAKVDSVEQVLQNWEAIKKQERVTATGSASALDGVPSALPALQRAFRLVDKAATVGFVWPDVAAARVKFDEEVGELWQALDSGDRVAIEDELGDVFFAAAALAQRAKVDPELAARRAAARFDARFRRLEQDLGKPVAETPLAELIEAWKRAKADLSAENATAAGEIAAEWTAVFRRQNNVRNRLARRVRDLPPDLVSRRPADSGEWSVREVLLHLIDVEGRVAHWVSGMAERAAREGVAPFPSSGLLEPAVRSITPPPGRLESPPFDSHPEWSTTAALLAALTEGRAGTTSAFIRIARFDPRRIVSDHPLLGPLDALQWGEFMAMHEARHLAQIERILTKLTNLAAGAAPRSRSPASRRPCRRGRCASRRSPIGSTAH